LSKKREGVLNLKRKLLNIGVAATVSLSALLVYCSPNPALAIQKNYELEREKQQIQEKKSDIQSEIHSKKSSISSLQAQEEKLNAEIKRLDLAVEETNGKIRAKEAEIAKTKEEIEKLRQEIAVVQERIEKRNELLRKRVRSIQESGGVIDYLDVLLGSQSFSDFISRVSAVTTFVEADKELLKAHMEDKKLLEEKQTQLSKELAHLEQALIELESMKKQLNRQIDEKNKLMKQVQKEQEDLHEELLELEDEADVLAAQERAIKQAIEEWNRQQRELEEARKRAASSRSQGSGGSSSAGGGGGSSAPMPSVTGGMFMKPTTGVLTSGFGTRWGKLHAGVDIANRAANVPVVAAADGIVFRSYYSSSYGNVIFITHHINGQTWTTVYAHLESRSVGEGARVKKGQLIGYMGNTGRSYGKHLHFELHKGPWNSAKSNAVNPAAYINF
jgi:peptidoglycan hydrolase CwlO-like protein